MLIWILVSIGAVIALVLLAAAVMPKEFTVSASTNIQRPSSEVFDFVVNLRNQEKYSKWVMADPNVKLTYTGTDGTVGFIAAWESNMKDVGIGAQEIKAIQPGKRYDVELRFEKPFKATNKAHTTTEAISATETKVTTTFEARNPFPMNLMIPMIKGMLLKDMNTNAANLKKLLENGNQ